MQKMLIAVCLIAFTSVAHSAPIVVDQQLLPPGGLGSGIGVGSSLGQSFTPTLDRIDAAEFRIRTNGTFSTIRLDVLEGIGYGGTILGSSADTLFTNSSVETVHFDLISSVSLTPGNQYTLRLFNSGGDSTATLTGASLNPYSGGIAISTIGTPIFSGDADFFFSEGIHTATVPEPTSLALLATGAFGFMGYGWRRKRKLTA